MNLEQASQIASIVIAAAAVCAIPFSLFAWRVSKRTLKHQLVASLYDEYKTELMCNAVTRLHEDYRYITGISGENYPGEDQTSKWINYYKTEYRKDPNRTLHFQRRTVSIFYQKLAYLAYRDRYLKRFVKKMWGKKEIHILRRILLPLEAVAVPEITGGSKISETASVSYPIKLVLKTFTEMKKQEIKKYIGTIRKSSCLPTDNS